MIPSNTPTTDQNNVYYSNKALIARISSYLNEDKYKVLSEKIEDYYLPWYVLDETNAPNSFVIDVYMRDKKTTINTIVLTSDGVMYETPMMPTPIFTTIEPEKYADKCLHLNVSSAFHSNSKIKEGTLSGSIKESNNIGGIDLICATENWYDENIIDEKVSNAIIYQNLVKEQLESLPVRKLDGLKDAYNEVENEIMAFKFMLEQVQAGKVESINSLQYDFQKTEIYNNLQTTEGSKSISGTFTQTGSAVAQAMFDFSQMKSFINPPNFYPQRRLVEPIASSLSIRGDNPLSQNYFSSDVDAKGNRADELWSKLVDATGVQVETMEIGREYGSAVKLTDTNQNLVNIYNVLHVDGVPIFSETGKLGEWYFDNVQRKFAGQDTSFATLDKFVSEFETKTESLVKYAELYATGGRGLLAVQAIMKAIRDLCQDSVDVSRYAPTKDGLSLFSYINRSPILAPIETHPYPSREAGDEERENIQNFDKTGFLSFPSIIAMLQTCRGNRNELISIMTGQMQNYTSNYDDVLQIWFATFRAEYTKADAISRAATFSDAAKRTYWPYFGGVEITHDNPENGVTIYNTAGRSFVNWNKMNNVALANVNLQDQKTQEPYRSMMWDISSGRGSTAEPKGRNENTIVNFGLDTDSGDAVDISDFFTTRKHNQVFSYASTVSIWKAVCTKTLEHMVNSVNTITNETLQNEIVSSMFQNQPLIDNLIRCIGDVAYELYTNSGLSFLRGPHPDGGMNITYSVPNEPISGFTSKKNSSKYQNTPGPRGDDVGKLYLDFVGGISKRQKITKTETSVGQIFSISPYIPTQLKAIAANSAYTIDPTGGFISPDVAGYYYDPLEFSLQEIITTIAANKDYVITKGDTASSPFGDYYTRALSAYNLFWRHEIFLDSVRNSLVNIQPFIDSLEPIDTVIKLYEEGHFNTGLNIANPQKVIEQINIQKTKNEASSDGISNKYKEITSWYQGDTYDKIIENEIRYIFVLGVSDDIFEVGQESINLNWLFIRPGSDEVITGDQPFTCSYDENDSNFASQNKESRDLINYLHVIRGIDTTENIFSDRAKLVYSDDVIDNSLEIFPWEAADFEDGEPVKSLDSIWSMSPWVFPRNYFYDVCIENKYHRTFAVYLTTNDLNKISADGDRYYELIGSIQWSVV